MSDSQVDPERTEKLEQIESSIQGIRDFISTIEENKKYVDGLVQNVGKAKERIDTAERQIGEQTEKVDSDVRTIETTKGRFETLKTEADQLSSELKGKQTDLQSQINKIQGQSDTLKTLEDELTDLKNKAETAKSGTEKAHQDIQAQQQTFQTSIDQTKKKLDELTNQQSSVQYKIDEIHISHDEIKKIHDELLVDEKDGEGEISGYSIKSEINNLLAKIQEEHTAITTTHQDHKDKFSKLYDTLNEKIRSLLPGAGAAGLASSYYEAKMKYTTTNDFSLPDDKKKKLSLRAFAPQWGAYIFHYILFLTPLVGLVWMFFNSGFNEIPDVFAEQPYTALLYKLTLTLPLVAISSFGFTALMTSKRLYEEYNHKQRVMQLYYSFKEEIELAQNPDLNVKLLHVMLDVVKDKPASKMTRKQTSLLDSMQDQPSKIVSSVTKDE